jgi:hypothetical protein
MHKKTDIKRKVGRRQKETGAGCIIDQNRNSTDEKKKKRRK